MDAGVEYACGSSGDRSPANDCTGPSARAPRDSAPAVTAASAEGWPALVERAGERELIDAAMTGAELGRGRFVLLYGQAGVGRSSMLRASVLDAQARGIDVLEAWGSELERSYAFGIVRQLLEARIAGLTHAQRRSILADGGLAAEAALGIGSSELRVSSGGFEQIEGVHRLMMRLAALKPLLVAVDDVQWCDRPSLDFLCFLGHRASRSPVTIIAAWRRGEPGVRAGRLQALAGRPDTLFLTLGPLSHAGVRAVLARETGTAPAEDAIAVIHGQTGGQPFLVRELAAGLRLRGIPANAVRGAALEAITPESVRRNIVARLGRHSETVQQFAQAVAVLGDTPLVHAAALAGIESDTARSAADALVRAGILRDDSSLGYAQPLLRAAVYDTLSSLQCAELHQRAAALLASAPGSDPTDLNRVAEHLLHSEPAGDPALGELLREAGRRAIDAGAPTDARRFLQRALGEIADAPIRVEVLIALAQLELSGEDPQAAADHAAEALSLASAPSARVNASLACAQALAATTGWAVGVKLLQDETALLDGSDPTLASSMRATVETLRACAGVPSWEPGDATSKVERLAGENPEQRAMLAAHASHMTLVGAGSASRVTSLCARAIAAGTTAQDSDVCTEYLAARAALLADGGDLAETVLARALVKPDSAAIDERGLSSLALRSQLALSRGELPAAAADARTALALLDDRAPSPLRQRMRCDLLSVSAVVAIEQAHHDDAQETLAQLSGATDPPSTAVVALRIALALSQSRLADAVASAAGVEEGPIGIAAPGISTRPWAALAHHAAGDSDAALALACAHLEYARAWASPSVLGSALVVRGVVDPGPQRLAMIEEAMTVLEPSSATLELARATIALGVALRRARRRGESRDHLVHGADLAHRCGADALAARARAELVSVGARPRRAAFSGVGSLTDGERRVALLAAAGMTNREIAHELTVSTKTVSGQLTAVYRKLDVHDRAGLTETMRQADEASADRDPEPVR